MPQNITTLTIPRIVVYSDPNYPEKEYKRLKILLDNGKREEVIDELRILYPKDSYLADLLANRLSIDLEKELGIIYHYQDTDSTTTAQITQDNTIEITTQYDNFHDTLQTIKNATQYKGNLADTLMAMVSGAFGAMEKGAEEITKLAGGKYQIAKYIFKAEGISVSATYGYGNNDGDIVKTGIGLVFEALLSSGISIALVGALSITYVPYLVIIAGISALVAALLLNTQAGKSLVNSLADDIIKPLIDSLQSKLQSFFSLFDSNPSNYELVSNPSLESNDYKSLIELLLDSNSTAKDIDSLLHSFPNYLKKIQTRSLFPLSPQGISFPYSSIIYLTTIKALKDTLKEYLPKAKKIVLYTPNPFVSLYTSSPFYVFNSNLSFFNPHLQYLLTSKDTQQWLYDTLFNLARDNREIIVYEWGGSIEKLDFKESQANKKDLDSKDTNQSTNIQKQTKTYYLSPQGQRLKEKQAYCIKVIAKESKVFTILRDFITSFNTTKEQEVFRALEILLKDKESLEHLRQCIIKSLKEPIIESIYSLKETKDLNKEELKENVEEVFNNLLGVIEKIYKEGSAYLYKQVLLFFLEIFNLFNIQSVFKKSNALNFGESLALSSNQTLLNVLKWANSKYNYALIHPILKIFTQDLVPLFALIENTMCHNTLILDDKMLIELSSFNLNSYPKIKANLEQNLAICIKSKEAVFGHLEDSHQANQKTANLESTESKEDKQDSLKVDLRDLEVLSLKGISKGENIQIYNQDFITKALAHQMNLDNNRLFYIESPFFNSREVENTKEKVA